MKQCLGVTCKPLSQCHRAGTCSRGICSNPVRDGADCDDGNDATLNDVCFDGTCSGVDPCALVTCPPINSCHNRGACVLGQCQPGAPLDNLTPCNDNNPNTANDVCLDGVCSGSNVCANVRCFVAGFLPHARADALLCSFSHTTTGAMQRPAVPRAVAVRGRQLHPGRAAGRL